MHVSNNRCIDPTALANMQPRSQVIDRVNRKAPPPSLPSRFSFGTSQFSKNTSAIGDVRRPIFSSLRATFIPVESFSTRNAVIPSGPRVLSTVANTTSRSATGPLVTKILLPLTMYLDPFLMAVVARLNVSEPLEGCHRREWVSAEPPVLGGDEQALDAEITAFFPSLVVENTLAIVLD